MVSSSDTERLNAALADIYRIAQVRAADSWARLPEPARGSLLRRQVSPELWTPSYSYQLGTYMTRGVSDPLSGEAAAKDAWQIPNQTIDALAIEHVNRLLRGDDPVMLGAAVWGLDAFDSPPPKSTVPPMTMATPFDGLVRRLWGSKVEDGIRIGPFRLVGPLEIVGVVVLGTLVWVPATLAVTYRLLHGERTATNVAKAIGGWAIAVAALEWALFRA